jgi:hypothetical protein
MCVCVCCFVTKGAAYLSSKIIHPGDMFIHWCMTNSYVDGYIRPKIQGFYLELHLLFLFGELHRTRTKMMKREDVFQMCIVSIAYKI